MIDLLICVVLFAAVAVYFFRHPDEFRYDPSKPTARDLNDWHTTSDAIAASSERCRALHPSQGDSYERGVG